MTSASPNDEGPDRVTGPPARDDEAVIALCLEGDQAAWAELVDRYGRLVYSIPRRYGLDADAADDVFQETFAILFRQLAGLRNRRGLPKWLMTTAHRVCRQHHRRAGSLPDAAAEALRVDEAPEALLLRWERQHELRSALGRLGDRCRTLLEALYLGRSEQSYGDVAARLGIPVGSIGPTRARCLKQLLALLEGDRPDDLVG